VIDPEVVASLVRSNTRQQRSALVELTDREREVLEMMAQGRTNAAIAAELHLSASSVEQYVTSIFSKLGLTGEPDTHRRVAAVLTFLRDAGRAEPL